MVTLRETILIRRPIEEVWDFITDASNHPRWQRGITSGETVIDESRRLEKVRFGFSQLSVPMERFVVAYEPPQKYEVRYRPPDKRGQAGRLTLETRYELEDVWGETRLRFQQTASGSIIFETLTLTFKNRDERRIRGELRKLKSILEQNP
jgi:uncharacterized protein YndB with AHSA1/START domain